MARSSLLKIVNDEESIHHADVVSHLISLLIYNAHVIVAEVESEGPHLLGNPRIGDMRQSKANMAMSSCRALYFER